MKRPVGGGVFILKQTFKQFTCFYFEVGSNVSNVPRFSGKSIEKLLMH